MTEFQIIPRPALSQKQSLNRHGVEIEALRTGTVLQLLGRYTPDAVAVVTEDVLPSGLSLRSFSPGQWFAVGSDPLPEDEMQALALRLKSKADIVDQSHGRVRILLRGFNARRVLAKGTALDLDPRVFPVGASAPTLIGHIGAHVTCVEKDAIELMVLRGFAESLWHDLDQMSLEFS
ncbi:sarcosine oxidase subunit gamma family protein [Allorhizobium undicola]|uniref:sarcosine oxidase subunit gamma family protein n=1 Tax=Allorhizobium undicola TaxID=78527 RepID=UPI003D326B9C